MEPVVSQGIAQRLLAATQANDTELALDALEFITDFDASGYKNPIPTDALTPLAELVMNPMTQESAELASRALARFEDRGVDLLLSELGGTDLSRAQGALDGLVDIFSSLHISESHPRITERSDEIASAVTLYLARDISQEARDKAEGFLQTLLSDPPPPEE